ncbi:hypothetical protein [Streptomyces sp. NPDC089919]|uniref:hypothetical protein n=1 Tax=Streptomyces sp. NPDC089919 TaxID=3155188 RepID=UPI003425AB74
MREAWGDRLVPWQEWLAGSRTGAPLLLWWSRADDLTALIGAERYEERLVELLGAAAPRDLAALGLGCNRRSDRSCREPGVCGLDPVPAADGGRPAVRSGPVAGACSGFTDLWTPFRIRVEFTADDRRSAVLLARDSAAEARLWVDGVPVAHGEWLDDFGYWQEDRYFVIDVAGPPDHPKQGHTGMPGRLEDIVSVLVHDAERGATHLLAPEPHQTWECPVVRVTGGQARVYADLAAYEAGRVDRVVGVGG